MTEALLDPLKGVLDCNRHGGRGEGPGLRRLQGMSWRSLPGLRQGIPQACDPHTQSPRPTHQDSIGWVVVGLTALPAGASAKASIRDGVPATEAKHPLAKWRWARSLPPLRPRDALPGGGRGGNGHRAQPPPPGGGGTHLSRSADRPRVTTGRRTASSHSPTAPSWTSPEPTTARTDWEPLHSRRPRALENRYRAGATWIHR